MQKRKRWEKEMIVNGKNPKIDLSKKAKGLGVPRKTMGGKCCSISGRSKDGTGECKVKAC